MGYPCIYNAFKDCDACGNCKKESQEDILVCENCEEVIQDYYYDINGEILCNDCMNKKYGKFKW